MIQVHPTAIVERGAILEEGVKIGPFAFIGENVRIGPGTEIGQGAVITGWTKVGSGCKIHTGAVIGKEAQVKGLGDIKSYLEIGNNNIIREYVTIHRSMKEEGVTYIGHDNFIMANVHIAHDCKVGNGVVITNSTLLGGHVEVEDAAFISSLVGIHQFVRIGRLAMIGGLCRLSQDAPPYMLTEGHPGRVRGLNIVGLKRAGYSAETIDTLKKAYKILFRSDLNMNSALKRVEEELSSSSEIEHLIKFIRASERGICRSEGGLQDE